MSPYESGDFDALFIFLSHTTKYIFVIPAFELINHKIFKNNECDGKQCITVYTSDYQAKTWGRCADLWTQKYCIDTEQPDTESKIKHFLEISKV